MDLIVEAKPVIPKLDGVHESGEWKMGSGVHENHGNAFLIIVLEIRILSASYNVT
jgi:hypothetical protein